MSLIEVMLLAALLMSAVYGLMEVIRQMAGATSLSNTNDELAETWGSIEGILGNQTICTKFLNAGPNPIINRPYTQKTAGSPLLINDDANNCYQWDNTVRFNLVVDDQGTPDMSDDVGTTQLFRGQQLGDRTGIVELAAARLCDGSANPLGGHDTVIIRIDFCKGLVVPNGADFECRGNVAGSAISRKYFQIPVVFPVGSDTPVSCAVPTQKETICLQSGGVWVLGSVDGAGNDIDPMDNTCDICPLRGGRRNDGPTASLNDDFCEILPPSPTATPTPVMINPSPGADCVAGTTLNCSYGNIPHNTSVPGVCVNSASASCTANCFDTVVSIFPTSCP